MEILAEAAAALMPGRVLVGMRDVKAHHWIRVDDTPVTLQISARKISNSTHEVSVQIRNLADTTGQKAPMPVTEGIVIFGDKYPAMPAVSGVKLSAERTSRLASADLYAGGLMFHGPCFQGVVKVDRSGQNGLTAQLRTLPAGNLFRSNPNPQFVIDPVALDAAGQLVGFWAAEYLQRGFVVFPYHLETLRIYGPNRAAGERFTCSVSLQLKGDEGIRSDIEMVGADGAVWMQLQGWADRRFDPPPQFHRAWIAPSKATISEPWQTPLTGLRDLGDFECYRLETLFKPGAGLWKDLWASLVLSREERKAFGDLRETEQQHQMEWLSARTVAKDAIGAVLRKHGLKLLPADIEIAQDERGRAIAKGSWTQQLRAIPELSLGYSEGMAVALVGDGSGGRRFGIDVQTIRELDTDFETSAFTNDERELLNGMPQSIRAEWLLRLWCAKGAVSKALGRSIADTPRVRILSFNPQTGVVVATVAPGEQVMSHTTREGARMIATAIYEKRTL
jgi:phosphopantetheinyl transferase